MTSPYDEIPRKAFWKSAVVGERPGRISGLYSKKFQFGRDAAIATAGSCFAQHIACHLRTRGYRVIDTEPPPPGLNDETARRFGYGLYSARYGNIYTARQLLQLAQEALGLVEQSDLVWAKGGRFYDALRPSVEPNGLPTEAVVRNHREYHLGRVREVVTTADVFVFTLGLTEAWLNRNSGTVYPTAPGVIAGEYESAWCRFHNFTFDEVYRDLVSFFDLAKKAKPDIRFILTVSPVPLTATAAAEHVLSATTYSKSVLRAVAGQLFHERDDVDYVPAYEIITSALSRGRFFESNLRSVRSRGVDAVMRMFFAEHDPGRALDIDPPTAGAPRNPDETEDRDEEVICEEALLEAFAP